MNPIQNICVCVKTRDTSMDDFEVRDWLRIRTSGRIQISGSVCRRKKNEMYNEIKHRIMSAANRKHYATKKISTSKLYCQDGLEKAFIHSHMCTNAVAPMRVLFARQQLRCGSGKVVTPSCEFSPVNGKFSTQNTREKIE